MLRKSGCVLGLLAILGGCDRAVEKHDKPTLDELGTIKLGATLPEVLEKVGASRFNPVSVKGCLEEMPIQGCLLLWDRDGGPFLFEEGIPLALDVEFNERGAAVAVQLSYRSEPAITRDECLSINDRILDIAAKKFGQFDFSPDKGGMGQRTLRRTAGENEYEAWVDKEGFVTSAMRTRPSSAYERSKPVVKWDDGRFVSILGVAITIDRDHRICMIDMELNEPDSVPRGKWGDKLKSSA